MFREDISHIFDENAYENLTEYSNSCVNIASGIHADVLYADTGNVNGSIIHTVVGTRIRQVKKIQFIQASHFEFGKSLNMLL